MIVFVDENEYSVDDGDFAIDPTVSGQNRWWNLPGSRHSKGTTWSFADGHAERYKLRDPESLRLGYGMGQFSAGNIDWSRLKDVTTVR
jgi:prepilin-type processing-associated H-X9-DG protein